MTMTVEKLAAKLAGELKSVHEVHTRFPTAVWDELPDQSKGFISAMITPQGVEAFHRVYKNDTIAMVLVPYETVGDHRVYGPSSSWKGLNEVLEALRTNVQAYETLLAIWSS